MAITARMNIDITLSTVAGIASALAHMEKFEQFYFQGLYELATEILADWPQYEFKNERAALRYMVKVKKGFDEVEKSLVSETRTLGAVLNFMLSEVTELYDLVNPRNKKRLEPLVDMISEYVDTMGAYDEQCIEEGWNIHGIFRGEFE